MAHRLLFRRASRDVKTRSSNQEIPVKAALLLAASLCLFASVMLLFWYILRLLMSLNNRR